MAANGPDSDLERICDEMRHSYEPRAPSDISAASGVDYVTTQQCLRDLRDEGFVTLDDDQGWRRARDDE